MYGKQEYLNDHRYERKYMAVKLKKVKVKKICKTSVPTKQGNFK